MYQLPNKPKGRNLDFLINYHGKLQDLYYYEKIWNPMKACGKAEELIYKFKDVLPDLEKDKEIYFYLLGKMWACHDYLEGDDQ